jgi:tRNA threonylcarbamoyladenosine biosynthesis protein TsaB
MTILALDTTMSCCSAALWSADRGMLVQEAESMERGHAEALAPMVERLFRQAELTPRALGRIAVTVGPGTFTGLRIGLSFAKGLGLALGTEVVGVSALAAMAAPLLGGGRPVAVASDARLGQAYLAVFDSLGRESVAPRLAGIEEAARMLAGLAPVLIGSAAADVSAALADPYTELRADRVHPVAGDFVSRLPVLPLLPPQPLYLKESDARPMAGNLHAPPDIRVAELSEMPVLAALHGMCFTPGWTAESLAGLAADPGIITLMALCDGKPCGMALARQAADEAEIITICTAPQARRRGIGSALVSALLQRLRARGVRQLFLEVNAHNGEARALYSHHQFREAGLRRGYYELAGGGRADALILRRDIAA